MLAIVAQSHREESSSWISSPCLCGKTIFSASVSALSASLRSHLIPLAILALAGCSSPGPNSPSKTAAADVVTTFDDNAHGIRLTYPGDWEEASAEQKPPGTVLLLALPSHGGTVDGESKFPAAFAIVSPDYSSQMTPADLPAMQQRTLAKAQRDFANFKLVSSTAASVGGEPARRIIFIGDKPGQTLQAMYMLTTHAGNAYAFSLVSSPNEFTTQRASAERVIESTQWAR